MQTLHILIASNNAHKHQEFREIFVQHGIDAVLHTPREMGIELEPDETAHTYVGNSQIKARAFYDAIRKNRNAMYVLADDSGLDVDALGGRPGVLSARYHKQAPHGDGCAALLNEMRGVPDAQRTGRFYAVIVLITPEGQEHVFEGICEGAISHEKRGAGGFGFDPVFIVAADARNRCMAELSANEKHRVSHRGIAAEKCADFLQ